jgi:hypothetical protein
MNMTIDQQDRFWDYQDMTASLTVEDLEASTKPLIKTWETEWWNYIWDGPAPGGDRPPNKPPHP